MNPLSRCLHPPAPPRAPGPVQQLQAVPVRSLHPPPHPIPTPLQGAKKAHLARSQRKPNDGAALRDTIAGGLEFDISKKKFNIAFWFCKKKNQRVRFIKSLFCMFKIDIVQTARFAHAHSLPLLCWRKGRAGLAWKRVNGCAHQLARQNFNTVFCQNFINITWVMFSVVLEGALKYLFQNFLWDTSINSRDRAK